MFWSYSHADAAAAVQLAALLKSRLAVGKNFETVAWMDTVLLPGEGWRNEIDGALANCDGGIVLVSPDMLNSDFIKNVELKALVDAGKPIIPLMLECVDFDRMDLGALAPLQVFTYGAPTKSQAFTQTSPRRDFADEAFRAIYDRLEKEFGHV